MTLDRIKLSAQTVRENIAILEECEEPEDAGYYLQLEHEKFVLECIEKQIPKKPILDTIFPSGVKWWRCPACRHNNIETNDRFCHNCGQALDWSDGE